MGVAKPRGGLLASERCVNHDSHDIDFVPVLSWVAIPCDVRHGRACVRPSGVVGCFMDPSPDRPVPVPVPESLPESFPFKSWGNQLISLPLNFI